jgi:hypothetical protein
MSYPQQEHYHLFARSLDGSEFANAIYNNKYDAAYDYMKIAGQVSARMFEHGQLTIELVVNSLEGATQGIWVGAPGLALLLSKCDTHCVSPTWN